MADSRKISVPDGLDGTRADQALSRMLGLSRSAIAACIDNGDVWCNNVVMKRSDRVCAGDWLDITLPEPPRVGMPEPKLVDGLDVVYSDDHLVVINKPVGVAVHTGPGWDGPTVLAGLMAMNYSITTSGAAERQGVVQRLDAATTGVMVIALSDVAYSVLKRAFKQRTIHKKYWALVQGRLDPLSGTIDAAIGRHPGHDWKFAVTRAGKPSITHYDTLEAFANGSLLDIHLETGRTHQIRVHVSALRHPCIGDTMYGADPVLAARLGMTRQALHAYELGFDHPITGEPMLFTIDYPDDMAKALEILREGM